MSSDMSKKPELLIEPVIQTGSDLEKKEPDNKKLLIEPMEHKGSNLEKKEPDKRELLKD